MQRRQFIQAVALSSVGAISPVESIAAAGPRTTLVLQVKGFTCITCAVGLDTLLGKEKGILSSCSTYPEGKVTVAFDPKESSEQKIREFIAGMGFTVASTHVA
ncbi:MAG TPA: heavy metal-associated domain-containing protein [Terracidiphilus sp.]|jgi:copper chaperone CopZ|nr:heavy metal-associated domain-containing protein [Terracidiphilus sp.]